MDRDGQSGGRVVADNVDSAAAACDWTRFTLRILVRADLEMIFRAWSTTDGLTRWLLASARFQTPDEKTRGPFDPAQPGDTLRWTWQGADSVMEVHVLAVHAPTKFGFEFGDAGNCCVKMTPQGDGTLVQLDQYDIPDTPRGRESHVECTRGWTFRLTNLKSVYEAGIDLREPDNSLRDVVNR